MKVNYVKIISVIKNNLKILFWLNYFVIVFIMIKVKLMFKLMVESVLYSWFLFW